MRVPEALTQLLVLHQKNLPGFRKEAEKILDQVWLEAYEEGLNRVFEAPGQEN